MIKDITYCSNMNCTRDCERNMNNKNFGNKIFSMSNFEYLTKNFDENECKYYMEEY